MYQLGLKCLAIGSVLLAFPAYSSSVFSSGINESAWKLKTSVFSCRLEHSVPNFGEAVFRTRAGEASGFYLRGRSAQFKADEIGLFASNPVWASESYKKQLTAVKIKKGTRPLWLGNQDTEMMLAQLNIGRELSFDTQLWYDDAVQQTALSISNIGFREVYKGYRDCLTQLVPRNFDQLKRTTLKFPAGELDKLPRSLAQELDYILTLVKHDDKVRVFYIDGHTDSIGDRDENLELSKVRAELVAQYLTRRGIPEDWITLRWHGERYPIAANSSAAGRAKNRRVTVRLERVKEMEPLPLASAK
jgi:outer membrane protein OmpA-like peptidoglycan-associated protein